MTAAALVQRYRISDPVGRLQVRWYSASGVGLVVGFVAYVVAVLTLPHSSAVGQIVITLFYLSAAVPPFFLVFAIQRYRLYEIDTILGRAFVYGLLTAILAGIYAASIRLFNAIFVGLTGESSEVALVITTLILATTFTPMKKGLERIVANRMGADLEADGAKAGHEPRHSASGDLSPGARPTDAPDIAAVLDDPAFASALDARIQSIVAGATRAERPGSVHDANDA